ncbi:glutathione S-transferase [Ruegeria pomeroyi]|uniref:Glutathione S-transferase family protein n=2 Tax=Ruegeria pomeroyi TaxID=89184 RepID=Q5LX57_RUEPO|nr:glutathione S-transferase [Ruegeria pomeroyi]HCE72220.1 glutathione S-transferase [Ruegeria sp.]AAV93590.1 glutathione S-transferase family protein [Ruegeria pomeroyi DSS-3]NVK99405.1 glutathione S-transferase [Ruegeria pomeroyi]NVL03901.1 glutathione S-transferase [Ruegeria pomeroyi]QWV10877.1 glutathione S-transferase [Ruegeria pomeroyi]
MKLYYSPTSPYVRKVMVLLHESGQLDDVDLDTAGGTPLAPAEALVGKNPLAKVPALERPDGPTLFDSRVICAYLDARGGAGFYPDGARRWDVLTLEALADGMLDAALLITYEARLRPEDKRWDSWTDSQWDKIARACSALEERWMAHLSGPLDMGQIAVGCALGYLDLRHDARGWREGHPALAAWFAGFESRPSMMATRPPAG